MRGRDELVERLSIHRRAQLGDLSDSAYRELEQAVRADPAKFVDDPADEAFSMVVTAADRYRYQSERDESFSEDEYLAARAKRLARLGLESGAALAVDPSCVDAALCSILACDLDPDVRLAALLDLDAEATDREGPLEPGEPADAAEVEGGLIADAWADVFCHGRLRVRAAIVQACLDSGRYRMAQEVCENLLALAPSDYLGARHGAMLTLARLEDEEGFEALDVRLGRRGDSWTHLGRVILLYKLGRTAAARRALKGYARLVEGGSYALLRPVLADTYVPDRPETKPCSFAEATLAVFEADPIIMDVPDFAPWAESVEGIALSARSFADLHGFDW